MAIYALEGIEPVLPDNCWIAPTADVIGKVRVSEDASIWFGAVLRGDNDWITIGTGSNVQDQCVLHTDPGLPLTIGANCTIGHRAILHGCSVGDGTLVGMGAVILNRASIGTGCLIAAHALIPEGKVIPDRSLVIGAPGRVARILTDADVAGLLQSAENYRSNWKRFKQSLERSPA